MLRTLEPEVMDTEEEARDYDAMDHAEVNRCFVADFLAALGTALRGVVLDSGTGTALIPIELCRQTNLLRVVAVDAAETMLALARANLSRSALEARVALCRADGKLLPLADRSLGAVVSNSLIHHLPEPEHLLRELLRVAAPGGLIFVRDLFRPEDEAALERVLETHAAGASPRQRGLLADSLRASLTVEEMAERVAGLGLPRAGVRASSDRHWTWSARVAHADRRVAVAWIRE